MGGGTVGVADIYGQASKVSNVFDPLGVTNPNSNGVTTPATQSASGGASSSASGNGPAIAAVGLIVSLVMLRVVIYLADRA